MQTNPECFGLPKRAAPPRSLVYVNSGNGQGSSGTCIRRYSTVVDYQGFDIVYKDDPALGASFTVTTSGIYAATMTDQCSTGGLIGISVNSNQLSTSINSISAANRFCFVDTPASGSGATVSTILLLNAGDIVRAHVDTQTYGSTAFRTAFIIQKMGL